MRSLVWVVLLAIVILPLAFLVYSAFGEGFGLLFVLVAGVFAAWFIGAECDEDVEDDEDVPEDPDPGDCEGPIFTCPNDGACGDDCKCDKDKEEKK